MMNELITIHTRFQHRRATAARWAEVNPILREGELGIELDTRRMKFGDGVTRWNSLEYCSKEILPASATELGGIKAEGKTDGYSVEVRIDPNTHKLYVPDYPQIPKLGAVATSNDYNDLNNKPDIPAPYSLPAASETVLGGIKAASKTVEYTVEVKKDPATHKLYVPASTVSGESPDNGILPGLIVKISYKRQDKSTHFTNETAAIMNGDIYFRPLCSLEHFNRILPNLYIGLARCNSRSHKIIMQKPTKKQIGWHIVGNPSYKLSSQERYPQKTVFTEKFNDHPRWTWNDTVPVAVADLISEYHGEWIKFPYDLETIARRFIYMYQIQYQTPKIYTVLPIDTLQGTQVKDGFLKISTIRRRVSLDMSRTTASDFYASVNLGSCFCRSETEPPHLQRTLLGPILPQRVIIVRKYGLNKVYYLMKSPERRSRITK